MIRLEIPDLAAFVGALRSVRWEPALIDAHHDLGEQIADDARRRGQALGGASGLTASAVASTPAFEGVEVAASAPYARGSEFGSGGGPTTQQFSRIPGPNREDGYWLGPALDEAQNVERRFEKMVDEVAREAFPG